MVYNCSTIEGNIMARHQSNVSYSCQPNLACFHSYFRDLYVEMNSNCLKLEGNRAITLIFSLHRKPCHLRGRALCLLNTVRSPITMLRIDWSCFPNVLIRACNDHQIFYLNMIWWRLLSVHASDMQPVFALVLKVGIIWMTDTSVQLMHDTHVCLQAVRQSQIIALVQMKSDFEVHIYTLVWLDLKQTGFLLIRQTHPDNQFS